MNGRVVGSALIGQAFTQAVVLPFAAVGGGQRATMRPRRRGTNKGPTDRKLADTLIAQARGQRGRRTTARCRGRFPADMVTSSASGLDPDISPANAHLQVARVAARAAPTRPRVAALVDAHIEGRQFGFFGEPRVNVLLLNIALDSAFTRRDAPKR